MELLKKINFKQPKYMIPALIYFPLRFTGYFAIDMFHNKYLGRLGRFGRFGRK